MIETLRLILVGGCGVMFGFGLGYMLGWVSRRRSITQGAWGPQQMRGPAVDMWNERRDEE